ncbi:MAG: TetR/AcrR family transcriptional regulator [Archangiaceae bacterium]|nr:TetR/AcrR family transcriptional regulator [Archangiaceae bacterium]
MADTRQRILEVALGLFNEQGLSRVGVRDVARATKMSPGNLAYHFATFDDLVAALVTELHEHNLRGVFTVPMERFTLVSLYSAATGAMRSMLRYRFVLHSYVDAVRASPRLLRFEATLAKRRRQRHDEMLAALVANGFVGRAALARGDVLYEQSALISSGWLTAAALRDWSDERAVRHFAKLGCALLQPHCTARGSRQMRQILAGAHDRERA